MVSAALALLALAAFWWKSSVATDELLETRTLEMLDQMLVKTHFLLFPFLPSYWLSSSVLQWADGVLASAVFFMLVLLSHALFFGTLAFTRLGNAFYDTASAVQSRPGALGPVEMVPRLERPSARFRLLARHGWKGGRVVCAGCAVTCARWWSKTFACSGATPRNGASP